MSGSLGEREIEVGTLARRASVSTLFRDFSNFHECVYKYGTRGGVFYSEGNGGGGDVFYFFYKITSRKLKYENSLLYQSLNFSYCNDGVCDGV